MSVPSAIAVLGLTKVYRVYDRPMDALREALTRRPRHREFRALDDVSFEVGRGQRVGIVGCNGAGKSTLLRILAGTLDHTAGRFAIDGRLRAVLELGTGFHEECTGRENILMGGLCMGYSRRELLERLDWIIEFSELGPVIDQPLRTYSSGMKSRLMYAVAFCMPVEIMVVDEALATGDGAFVRKCTNHIVDLCSHGTTALIVSHNLYFLERLCDRVLYLRRGRLLADGEPLAVCKQYEEDLGRDFVGVESGALAAPATKAAPAASAAPAAPETRAAPPVFLRKEPPSTTVETGPIATERADLALPAPVAPAAPASVTSPTAPRPQPGGHGSNGAGEILQPDGTWAAFDFGGAPAVRHLRLVRLLEASLLDADGRPCSRLVTGQPARFRFVFESRVRKRDAHVGIMIWHEKGVHVATTTNVCALDAAGRPDRVRVDLVEGVHEIEVAFPSLQLGAGRYWLKLGVHPGWEHYSDDDQFLAEHRCVAFAVLRTDHVQDVFYEPVSRWSDLRRRADLPPDEPSGPAVVGSDSATAHAPGAV